MCLRVKYEFTVPVGSRSRETSIVLGVTNNTKTVHISWFTELSILSYETSVRMDPNLGTGRGNRLTRTPFKEL